MRIVLALSLVLLIATSAMAQNRRDNGTPPPRQDTTTNQKRDTTPPPSRNNDNVGRQVGRDRTPPPPQDNNRQRDGNFGRIPPPPRDNNSGVFNRRGDNGGKDRTHPPVVGNGNGRDRTPPPPRDDNRNRNGRDRTPPPVIGNGNGNPRRDNNGDTHMGNMTFYNPNLSSERLDRYQRDNARAVEIFRNSREGRRFDWGVQLRRGEPVRSEWRAFFRHSAFGFYPHYSHMFVEHRVHRSLFWRYGVCPPYIYSDFVVILPSVVVYVDVPVYRNNVFVEYVHYGDSTDGGYYLAQGASLAVMSQNLANAFASSDIELLATLVDPDIKIAVCNEGKYEYSISSNDYLDLTRDAFHNIDTESFTITKIRKVTTNTYVVYAKHVYSKDGLHTMYLNFVVQEHDGVWVIVQIETSPEKK